MKPEYQHFFLEGERLHPITDVEIEELLPYLSDHEKIVDGPFFLLKDYYRLRSEHQRLSHSLQEGRILLHQVLRLFQQLRREVPQQLAGRIQDHLARPSQRPRHWNLDVEIREYLIMVLKEYVQDCHSVQAVAEHPELAQLEELLLHLERWESQRRYGDQDPSESLRLELWRQLGELLPQLWD